MVTTTIYRVAILFVMMIPGVVMKKCKLCSDTFGKGLSNLVLYIAQPALVFTAYLRDFDSRILLNSLFVLALSVVTHLLFVAVATAAFKRAPDMPRRMLTFATVFSNAAFMAMPLVLSVLGGEAMMYASVYNITFNLFLWSFGVRVCTSKRDKNENGVSDDFEFHGGSPIVKALLHPVTIAAALGLVFFILPINGYIPSLVTDSLDMLADLVAPLSMMVIGLRLPDVSLKGIFRDKHMYVFLALRHFILPLSVIGVMFLVSLSGAAIDSRAYKVLALMAAAPAATSATMFAEKFDCDAAYVSRLVVVSTILSIGTMPLMIYLAEFL